VISDIARYCLGVMLIVTGTAKICSSDAAVLYMRDIGISRPRVVSHVVNAIELAIGSLLLTSSYSIFRWGALILAATFMMLAAYASATGISTSCGCAGKIRMPNSHFGRWALPTTFFLLALLSVYR
jgi:uncharacterized membrane protein YphA (DoxX/SURF4 family)